MRNNNASTSSRRLAFHIQRRPSWCLAHAISMAWGTSSFFSPPVPQAAPARHRAGRKTSRTRPSGLSRLRSRCIPLFIAFIISLAAGSARGRGGRRRSIQCQRRIVLCRMAIAAPGAASFICSICSATSIPLCQFAPVGHAQHLHLRRRNAGGVVAVIVTADHLFLVPAAQ